MENNCYLHGNGLYTGLIVSKSKPARHYSFTGNLMIGLKLSRTKGRWTAFSDKADSGDWTLVLWERSVDEINKFWNDRSVWKC